MKTLRHLFGRSGRANHGAASRFDRYYGGVVRPGAGYPTADEARQDMLRHDRSATFYGWSR